MTVGELLNTYEDNLRLRGLTDDSQYRYIRIAEAYLASLGEDTRSGVLSRETVMSFLRSFSETSGSYRRFVMYVVKGLFEAANVKWPFTKRDLPKMSRPSRPYFTIDEMQSLLDIARPSALDYTLLRIDAVTGARREELSRMLLEDYVPPTIRVRTAKGGEERIRTLDRDTVLAVNRYLITRRSKSNALFVSRNGVPLSTQMLSKRFRRLADRAGIKKGIGWHAIRRGVATWLFKGGMRERELQDALGWKSPAMPSQYIQLVASEVEAKIIAVHPMFARESE